MKLIVTLSFLVFSLFILGCASSGGTDTARTESPAAADTANAETTGKDSTTSTVIGKTAYDGTTGSGLLMERYKSGQIEGYRD